MEELEAARNYYESGGPSPLVILMYLVGSGGLGAILSAYLTYRSAKSGHKKEKEEIIQGMVSNFTNRQIDQNDNFIGTLHQQLKENSEQIRELQAEKQKMFMDQAELIARHSSEISELKMENHRLKVQVENLQRKVKNLKRKYGIDDDTDEIEIAEEKGEE